MVSLGGNDQFELLRSVAMAMLEFRGSAMGEGGLMPGQRGQPDIGIGKNLRAVAPRDSAMVVRPLGVFTVRFAPCARGADLVLRLERDALLGVAAMIDARVDAERGATAVHIIGPGAAPMLQQQNGRAHV